MLATFTMSHGHSHGGAPCNGHHGHGHGHGHEHKTPYTGPVADDPSLLEAVDHADAPFRDRTDGYDDVLGSGSLLIELSNTGGGAAAAASAAADAVDDDTDTDLRPKKGQKVTLRYSMVHLDSAIYKLKFDTEEFVKPEQAPQVVVEEEVGRIGEGDFVTAIDMALQMMPGPGCHASIRAQARHCYHTAGKPGVFRPGADLYVGRAFSACRQMDG